MWSIFEDLDAENKRWNGQMVSKINIENLYHEKNARHNLLGYPR
jgi:hypothetical protein